MTIVNKNLGTQAKVCNSSLASVQSQLAAWQSANSKINMTGLNSASTETIFAIYEQSQTNVNYLLLYMLTASMGRTPSGSPPGTNFPTPTSVATVSYQAQAVLNFTVSLTGELDQYCQQYTAAADQVNNNCSCPTLEQCSQVKNY